MTTRRPPAGLGRWGTAPPEPWHHHWLELRSALKLAGELGHATTVGDVETGTAKAIELARSTAFSSFITAELDGARRGRFIADVIRAAAADLARRLELPLARSAGPEQAILFWYLTISEGQTARQIGRRLSKYVTDANTRDAEQWVASRMWATGQVPHAGSSPGLAELTRHIDLRLAASDPSGGSPEAARMLVIETLDRLFLEDPACASWMAVFAHFGSEPIPITPLQEAAPRGLPHVRGRLDRLPLDEYVERLDALGLLIRLEGGAFVVPVAIARATLSYLDDELRKRALRAAVVLLGMVFEEDCDEQPKWPVSESLVSHVLSVATLAGTVPMGVADAALLFNRAAIYYRARAHLDQALSAGRRAVTAMESAYGPSSPMLAGPLGDLAHALMIHGDLIEAEEIFRRVFDLEAVNSSSYWQRATTLNLYGNLLRRMDRFQEAEAAHREALHMFPHNDRSYVYWQITNDLALTLRCMKRPEEALSLFRGALERLNGAEGTRAVKRNIGLTLRELGRNEEARDVLEEVLTDQAAMPVPDSGFMAWVLKPLAAIYRAVGDDAGADEAYQRLADIDQPWVT